MASHLTISDGLLHHGRMKHELRINAASDDDMIQKNSLSKPPRGSTDRSRKPIAYTGNSSIGLLSCK